MDWQMDDGIALAPVLMWSVKKTDISSTTVQQLTYVLQLRQMQLHYTTANLFIFLYFTFKWQ